MNAPILIQDIQVLFNSVKLSIPAITSRSRMFIYCILVTFFNAILKFKLIFLLIYFHNTIIIRDLITICNCYRNCQECLFTYSFWPSTDKIEIIPVVSSECLMQATEMNEVTLIIVISDDCHVISPCDGDPITAWVRIALECLTLESLYFPFFDEFVVLHIILSDSYEINSFFIFIFVASQKDHKKELLFNY